MSATIENQMVSKSVNLVYSPDDGGWYFHNYDNDAVSITYPTESDARMAWANHAVNWESE